MSPLQTVFRFLSALLSVYMLLIIFRVLLSWFQGRLNGKGIDLLKRATDPYLNFFQRIRWMRIGFLDFSPVAAIALLGLLSQICNSLAVSGRISAGMIISYILASIWSFISFFITFLIILMALRLVVLLFFSGWNHPVLYQLDNILYKATARILGFFTTKTIKYTLALGISMAVLLLLRLAIGYGLMYLLALLQKL